jgi:hypothetical protein
MIRLPLRELEEALTDPSSYRIRLSSSASTGSWGPFYFGALRDAIFKYHNISGATEAEVQAYLNDRLSRFRNDTRKDSIIGQLEWYLKQYADCGLTTFQTRLRVEMSLPKSVQSQVVCTGQVSRLDIQPAGGYAAWLFRSKKYQNWSNELQMPLTQLSVANKLNVPSHEITIGIYSFEEKFVDEHKYTQEEIDTAYQRLTNLLTALGF